jgi:xylulokinase
MLTGVADERLLRGVGAVGITSQVNTHVFVDARGRALAPAITWADTRAAGRGGGARRRIAAEDRCAGGAPHGRGREPRPRPHGLDGRAPARGLVADGRRAPPKDFVLHALTGALVSDPMSNIGLVGADLAYPSGALALVPGASDRLPPLAPSTSVAGHLALAPGLPRSRSPSASWTPGRASTAWACAPRATPPTCREPARSSPPPRNPRPESPASSSSPAMGACGSMSAPPSPAAPPSPGSATSTGSPRKRPAPRSPRPDPTSAPPLPAPTSRASARPLWDPQARGAFLGSRPAWTRAALARGVLEGVALSARLLLEAMDRSTGRRAELLLCGGGGFRSEPGRRSAPTCWAAPCAAPPCPTRARWARRRWARSRRPPARPARRWPTSSPTTRPSSPDPRRAARYDDLFALYRPAYEALRPSAGRWRDRRNPLAFRARAATVPGRRQRPAEAGDRGHT